MDRVLTQGEIGDIRLIDYEIDGIPHQVSLINTTNFDTIIDVTSCFDISVCAISCTMMRGTGEFRFRFNWGTMTGFCPQDDILSGIGHFMYATTNPKRLDKYTARGFSSMNCMDKTGSAELKDKFESIYHQKNAFPETEILNLRPSIYAEPCLNRDEIRVMTFNCDSNLSGSNGVELANFIISNEISYACLQEVTKLLLDTLKHELTKNESGYSIYTVVDNTEAPDGFYGLCFITNLNVEQVWSLPLPSEQSRRLDILFSEKLIIANVHAESLTDSELFREKQIAEVMKHLNTGMDAHRSKKVLMVGDFNVSLDTDLDHIIKTKFTDTNIAEPQNTMRVLNSKVRYYDRILMYGQNSLEQMAVLDWSLHEAIPSDHLAVMVNLTFKDTGKPKKKERVCGLCGESGHNKRTCKKKAP